MKNIVLIGLPGSGKTVLGQSVAGKMGLKFIDTDEQIEKAAGMPITQIFEIYGEAAFRDRETQAAHRAAEQRGAVIATGGGMVLREENIKILRKSGRIVFLDRPPEKIAEDIISETRPLLAKDTNRIFALAKERRDLYLAAADIVFENTAAEQDAQKELLAVLYAEFLPHGFAVIGDPIGHTLSPVIHGAAFGALGIPKKYNAIHVKKGELAGFMQKVRGSGLTGFNITSPHKQEIIPLLDWVEEEARFCGAVNTVVLQSGRLCGYNTDMNGLLCSLMQKGHGFKGRKILLLGTGGVAGSIALKAAREGAQTITVLGRRINKAEEIRERVKAVTGVTVCVGSFLEDALTEAAGRSDLLINATTLGMTGVSEDFKTLEFLRALPKGALVCDLIYSPVCTALLKQAQQLGLDTQNGLGMLVYQALIADELFLEEKMDKDALFRAVSEALRSEKKGESAT